MMNDLLEKQDQLQKEAKEVLEELKLLELLGKLGEVSIVGSLETGLMVWRDIDIEVWVEEIEKAKIAEAVKDLISDL